MKGFSYNIHDGQWDKKYLLIGQVKNTEHNI